MTLLALLAVFASTVGLVAVLGRTGPGLRVAGRTRAGGWVRTRFPRSVWLDGSDRRTLATLGWPAAAAVALALLVHGSLPFAALAGGLGLTAGVLAAARREERLQRSLADQMPGFARRVADGVRAGLPLPEAIARLGGQCPQPLDTAVSGIARAYGMGSPLAWALDQVRVATGSPEFAVISEAITLCQERGGPLPDLLDRIADSLQELRRLKEKIDTSTAGARMSIKVMLLTPFVMVGMLGAADPHSIEVLLGTFGGWVVVALALTLTLVAARWSRSILRQYL